MEDKIYRKLFLGFIQIHILHHAKKEPFYGSWMIEELKEHGYTLSSGTLYPILQRMETFGFLKKDARVINGKVRKYYWITSKGNAILEEAKAKAKELYEEIKD